MTDFIIDVHDPKKSFGTRRVVDGLNLQVKGGEICGFLGANGSGKTTTIRMLCGLLVPDGGSGTCLGHDIIREASLIRREVGYMTQKFSLYEDLTVRENLDLVASVYQMANPREAVTGLMEEMGLADRRDQLAGELSGGWKQRLALAACVLHQPKLLQLDEPTAGVDAKARREFWDLIHDMAGEGMTTLVSTHYMDEAERCKTVVFLANGRIVVQGETDDVAAHSALVGAKILTRRRGICAARPESRRLPCSGALCVLQGRTARRQRGALVWHEVEPRLEDVFIHMLSVKGEES